ncbi:hypothetical protein BX600DRAFT_29913 [Xylariales sp. PMI_506]|nr:hypothetical protein BX600DRAFT_29913 [Xylariales sp. PMI_506]
MTMQPGDDLSTSSTSPATSVSADGSASARLPAMEELGSAPRRAKRAQVSRACARCRRLQKGCSESRPCQRCIKTGLAEQCLAGGAALTNTAPQSRYGTGSVVYELSTASTSALMASPTLASMGLANTTNANLSRELFQRQAGLLPPRVIDHCVDRFFGRLSPTIPIISADYIDSLRKRTRESTDAATEAYCVLLGMCTMVLLQVEEPGGRQFSDLGFAETNAAYGWKLLEEALSAHRHLGRRANPSFENVLLAFFIYACHAALLYHSQAFFFLRETTTLYLLFKPEALPESTRLLADRLFWVLIASERGHAIRYRRPITLQITASSPSGVLSATATTESPSLGGFRCLAALFRPLDTSFIAILNTESVACPPSPEALDGIEADVNAALTHSAPFSLHQIQKANLRVTQLWLRIIIWQVRLRLGYLQSESAVTKSSHTYHYPLEVAKELTSCTRDLEIGAMMVHGAGLTEKLFDIACVVVNVLARVPLGFERTSAEDDLRYIRSLITKLPGGTTVYEKLMVKHLMSVLPRMVGN